MKIDKEWLKENISVISIDKIDANPWNPNEMTEKQFESLKINIQQKGFKGILILRKKKDRFEIIDGEQRYKAVKEIGLSEIPAIVVAEEDNEARIQTLAFNVRGEYEPIKLSNLLKELRDKYEFSVEDLVNRIGMNKEEIEGYLDLVDFDWGQFEQDASRVEDNISMDDLIGDEVIVYFTVTGEMKERMDNVLNSIKREKNIEDKDWQDIAFVELIKEKEKRLQEGKQ